MIYVIPKGQHKSSYLLSFTFKDKFQYFAEFTDSCIYTSVNPNNQFDINKLFGVSEGIDPHWNSARFGWRPLNDDKISIFAYCYNRGERIVKHMIDVELYSKHFFSLILIDNLYHFEVDRKAVTVPREKGWGLKYRLWPYFGGDEVAPHDIFISLT